MIVDLGTYRLMVEDEQVTVSDGKDTIGIPSDPVEYQEFRAALDHCFNSASRARVARERQEVIDARIRESENS